MGKFLEDFLNKYNILGNSWSIAHRNKFGYFLRVVFGEYYESTFEGISETQKLLRL